jgi:integrase
MDRSLSTIERYSIVSTMLKRAYLKSSNAEFNPVDFLDWSISEHLNLSSATVRQYKAALRWFFETNHQDLLEIATNKLKMFVSNNKHTHSKRQKRKSYSERDLSIFLEFLFSKIKPKYSENEVDIWENAYYTIRAGAVTGLRPEEWLKSILYFYNDEIFLIVKNGKATNGRSHGEFRKINISALQAEDIAAISKKIELTKVAILSGFYKNFKTYHKAVSGYLLRANNAVFPNAKKTFCAYSCRHQVTSNLKVSGATSFEIAAILGHKSVETHRLHYQRKSKSGSASPASISASIEDVITVTQLNPNGPRNIAENAKPASAPVPPASPSSWGPKF